MEVFDDIEAACIIYALYEEHELKKKNKLKIHGSTGLTHLI